MRVEPKLSGIPVIVVSGYAEQESPARERAVAEFFVKPASLPELMAAIDRHCGHRAERLR